MPLEGTLLQLRTSEGLRAAMLLLFCRFALCFLVLLHCFALIPGLFICRLPLLLGGFLGFAAVFPDASIFSLGVSGYRPSGNREQQNQESGDSFHYFSERVCCCDINTGTKTGKITVVTAGAEVRNTSTPRL